MVSETLKRSVWRQRNQKLNYKLKPVPLTSKETQNKNMEDAYTAFSSDSIFTVKTSVELEIELDLKPTWRKRRWSHGIEPEIKEPSESKVSIIQYEDSIDVDITVKDLCNRR